MQKAVFIDRDGVINDDSGHYYIFRIKDFKLNSGVIGTLKTLQERGYLLIIITNQGGIARRKYSADDVEKVHLYLKELLIKKEITLTDIFYCPHHDTVEKCLCRKPEPLMIQKAMAMYNVDPLQSYFIGDKESDIKAGAKAGIKTIQIEPNSDMQKIMDQIN